MNRQERDRKIRSRKAPTLIQNRVGQWYCRFRRDGIDLPIGIQTPKHSKSHPPPENGRYEWIQVGKYWYPKHVYDKFTVDFELPYLRGEFTPSKNKEDVLVSDAVAQFIDRDGLTKSTKRSYRGVLHLFVDRLIDRRMYMRELRPEDMSHFMELCQSNTPRTRFSYAKQINTFVNWADNSGLLEAEELRIELGRTAAGRLGRKLFLTPTEYVDVRASILRDALRLPEKQRKLHHLSWTIDVIDLALSTGLRINELVHLQWQDIKLERGILEVRPKTEERDGIDFMPKGKRARFVELQPLAIEVLNRSHVIEGKVDPQGRVLKGALSDELTAVPFNPNRASKNWRKHRKLVNISDPVPLHGLRHMFVTYSLIVGWEPFYVQQFAGHSSLATTEGYAQFARQLCSRKERENLIRAIESIGFIRP